MPARPPSPSTNPSACAGGIRTQRRIPQPPIPCPRQGHAPAPAGSAATAPPSPAPSPSPSKPESRCSAGPARTPCPASCCPTYAAPAARTPPASARTTPAPINGSDRPRLQRPAQQPRMPVIRVPERHQQHRRRHQHRRNPVGAVPLRCREPRRQQQQHDRRRPTPGSPAATTRSTARSAAAPINDGTYCPGIGHQVRIVRIHPRRSPAAGPAARSPAASPRTSATVPVAVIGRERRRAPPRSPACAAAGRFPTIDRPTQDTSRCPRT